MFSHSFARSQQEVLADLMSTLDGLGKESLGAESSDITAWVGTKDVDSFGVDEVGGNQSEEAPPV